MSDELLGAVEAAVADGDLEAALLLHLGSDIGGLPEAGVEAFRTNPVSRPMYCEMVVQAPSIAPALRTCTKLDSAEPYRRVDVPTLLLLGSASPRDPFRTSVDALMDVLPHGEVAVLEGQGHIALLTAPHLVAEELRRFLRS